MRITLIRSATLVLELHGRRILVDPMLDPPGARPPLEGTANPVRNPTVDLPIPAKDVVRGLDGVLEALNHWHLTRAELGAAVADVVVPRDGETIEL